MKIKHDMSTIIKPVYLLADTEYERASKLHGDCFASPSEGFGVIAEEVQEAGDEVERIESAMRQLLIAIREENSKTMIDCADAIRDMAVSGASELIQVAAMCRKLCRTVRNEAAV